ncbi:uncharacterized protein LOC112591765 [Melanaphis sacchari]|uniref:uncharacterized protein LOC112591765 n=1 Tax=Melanaphis sacchari TaxID=742174 RepID=UPI000DC14A69|nr:uncharacterized protein LOC112591765 [Melanaphis sacchari]XP_025191468.1 uncharacterized protein LOC112591765 [Melanaphis sacchari]
MSKILLHLDDWENFNRPGDWILEKSKYTCLSRVNHRIIYKLLLKLHTFSTWRYVNKIEFLTILFRFHRKFTKNYDLMYSLIKDAVSEPVITPEDRLRNLEAHELFSMFLMERNEIAITKAKEIGASKAYNTFLRNPRYRKKL